MLPAEATPFGTEVVGAAKAAADNISDENLGVAK